jgi:hypothetical protein
MREMANRNMIHGRGKEQIGWDERPDPPNAEADRARSRIITAGKKTHRSHPDRHRGKPLKIGRSGA